MDMKTWVNTIKYQNFSKINFAKKSELINDRNPKKDGTQTQRQPLLNINSKMDAANIIDVKMFNKNPHINWVLFKEKVLG